MRRQGLGLIVNLSPVAGKVSMPFAGLYSATKHAVEALSDALRLEVKLFGIRVILIEPGTIKTGFDGIALGELRRTAKLDAYRGLRPGRDGLLRMRPWHRDRCEGGPRAIEAKRPKGHTPATLSATTRACSSSCAGCWATGCSTGSSPASSVVPGETAPPQARKQATRAGEHRVPPVASRVLSGSARGRLKTSRTLKQRDCLFVSAIGRPIVYRKGR